MIIATLGIDPASERVELMNTIDVIGERERYFAEQVKKHGNIKRYEVDEKQKPLQRGGFLAQGLCLYEGQYPRIFSGRVPCLDR